MNNLEVLHSRYAQALFRYAKENNIEDDIKNEYESLCSVFEEHPDYKKIFVSPHLTRKEKIELVEDLKKNLNLSDAFTSFLKVLVEANRFAIIRGVFLKYKDLYALKKGIIRVNVYSAKDLLREKIEELKSILKKRFRKEIEIKNIVDEEILGGLKIEVEDSLIDASLKGKLNGIKESIAI
ncbi:MAG: ATP synthase F1 subunit delta [Candidatus Omnitrophica bacterium]|nr:ATP synthase F1 subunit delta [Candidatus Omnitrophota bacterium]